MENIQQIDIPTVLPILPLKNTVIYPYMMIPLTVGRDKSIKLINDLGTNKVLGLISQTTDLEDPEFTDLYSMGTAAVILKMMRMPDGTMSVIVQGIKRIMVKTWLDKKPYFKAEVRIIDEDERETVESEGVKRHAISLLERVVSISPDFSREVYVAAINTDHPGRLADLITSNLNLKLSERQQVLETLEPIKRLLLVSEFLQKEIEILEVADKIQSQVKEELSKAQRQAILREQLKAIQRELGEADDKNMDVTEFRKKLGETELPEQAKALAEREIEKLERMPTYAAEYIVSRTYLDWLLSLPWKTASTDNLSINEASTILDEDHYNLEKPKERILDFLAVRKLKGQTKGPILCFVGPPGVGKTSLGQSIARAMNRKFIRISLGGMRDEAEIRGHRRTYVGAIPGRIMQNLRNVGVNNPVFMLDEIDKIGMDFRGDPSAALLEVLDPEQNHSFADHYIEAPFDLSSIFFILTANLMDTVPPALRDRMEVIELPGYTEPEKIEIAKKYLVSKQVKENGLSIEEVKIYDDALQDIIRYYTREAGVRNLERSIARICRKIARKKSEENLNQPIIINSNNLSNYLGVRRYRLEEAQEKSEVGVATGLAVTPAGGEVLLIETAQMEGKGVLSLTGQLGEVMQESAKAGLTYIRTRAKEMGLETNFYENKDLHIHVPAGAIPKDGPSAGIAIAVSVLSSLTRKPIRKDVAMTGEITLRGKVLSVGGIKEKVMAAQRAGIQKVIIPLENEKDLEEVPAFIKEVLDIKLVKHMDEVLCDVFEVDLPPTCPQK
ncbi:MAG: Lon protease 1 [candidate division WS2 bacterium]|uniref:Lon protease n=1 Tax=Psychracetigena formicireducens TaxID=2986056 RepID=A0A9E2BGT7_PSYF1|nr:Lon protease 1 [Candidatus Psychracetigena formicireducens]MBT9145321.1 Lon protease 1 [Candidatus Psychracetigena formicireducens]MBT9150189.1 Lon protease 1 [Candidatus Psychracetigena formicireducens]